MKKHVLMIAPIHRPWGNRIIRESLILKNKGYKISLLMRNVPFFDASELTERGIDLYLIPAESKFYKRLFRLPRMFINVLKINPDIYHLHNPDTLPLAFMLKIFGKKVVYDTHEDFSKRLLLRKWIPKFLRPFLCLIVSVLEKCASRYLDLAIVTQYSLEKKYKHNCITVRNFPYVDKQIKLNITNECSLIPEQKVFRLIYVGGISKSRGVLDIISILDKINKKISARLWLIGHDMDNIIDELKRHKNWMYVDYLGEIEQDKAFAFMKKSNLGLVLLHDTVDHSVALPNKLFEYMLMGLPFVASDFKVWKNTVGSCDAGWWIEPQNEAALLNVIKCLKKMPEILDKKRINGLEFSKIVNWENECEILIKRYARL